MRAVTGEFLSLALLKRAVTGVFLSPLSLKRGAGGELYPALIDQLQQLIPVILPDRQMFRLTFLDDFNHIPNDSVDLVHGDDI